MDVKYIIVQAGGKGTRMEHLTQNKPKALVPVQNMPMLFHLFKKYPDKKYIIIGDYKYDVLEKYLHAFADVDYQMVCASGNNGTCAGLSDALAYIPSGCAFLLIWCDLILPQEYTLPDTDRNVIGISKDFPCRWKYDGGEFVEERSTEHGVAGHFIFQDKSCLEKVPADGEFVRWLQSMGYQFEEQPLYHTHEYGLYSEWDKLDKVRCRPFNRIRTEGSRIIKEAIDEQGMKLAKREVAWYRKLKDVHFAGLPEIYEYEPLCMERIDGKNIYEYTDIPIEKKREILKQIIGCLKEIHNLEQIPSDCDSYYEAYIGKTFDRLEKVRDLVPFANDETIVVNGKTCRNVFYHREELEQRIMEYFPKEFCLIHGDCTFSNMLMKQDTVPVMIDPRGYFGNTELYGDVAYDWVKLYYSLYSNYDQFNLKRFRLEIREQDVQLVIESNQWEKLEDEFFTLVGNEVNKEQIRLLLAIIWLSLTTYAWEDYDSICGAFYEGIYLLEEVL